MFRVFFVLPISVFIGLVPVASFANKSFMDAVEEGRTDKAKLLIEGGVDVDTVMGFRSAPGAGGETALHFAIINDFDFFQFLIKEGANVNKKTANGLTPLHYITLTKKGDNVERMVHLLVEEGAKVNARTKIWEKATPLHYVVASPEQKYNGGENTLSSAQNFAFAQILFEKGARLNVKDKRRGETPLHLASGREDDELLRLLVGLGADVNARNHKKQTPLHIAVMAGSLSKVKELVEHGANIDAKDRNGDTPYHRAIDGDSKEIIDFLQKRRQSNRNRCARIFMFGH